MTPEKNASLSARLEALTEVLVRYQQLWRPVPFYHNCLPWESTHAELATALRHLTRGEAAALEADTNTLITWLNRFVPGIQSLSSLQESAVHPQTAYPYDSRFHRDIPGRKWQQIQAFAGCIHPTSNPTIEWCAGKAHLGRALYQRFGAPITALEWNEALCQKGNRLSEQHRVNVKVEHCDVLSTMASSYLQQASQAVALHACGDLHRRLIELVVSQGVERLFLSPCCYHLSKDKGYAPFSKFGANSGLILSRDDCRLAVQETVTASSAEGKRRDKKNAWRLGFDQLQRKLRQQDGYLPIPPIPDRLLAGNFQTFCNYVAQLKGLYLPSALDWAAWEARGWQRQSEVFRMDLPRHAFRRALELYLVIDRALFLEESGYKVQVSCFCERELTPRNLLISASLAKRIAG